MKCPFHGGELPCDQPGCHTVATPAPGMTLALSDPSATVATVAFIPGSTKPGDDFPAFVDPLVRRGEALEQKRAANGSITAQEAAELRSIKELVRARAVHDKAFAVDDPSTPVDEGETEIARKMRIEGEWLDRLAAVEKVLLRIVETMGTQLGAAAVGALQAEVDKLLKR